MNIHNIIGLKVAATNYAEATQWVVNKAINCDKAYAVEASNTHVAALVATDPEFSEAMSKFDLIVPDGTPLVWVINARESAENKLKDRVYGPSLMLEVIKRGTGPGLKHFFLGGGQSTLDKLVDHFNKTDPTAIVAGTYSPPFGEWPQDEFVKICDLIRASGANCVWVGLGCPKQEKWIAKHKEDLPPAVYFGIGAAFAFHAGEVKQAPQLLQKFGLEWLFRLAVEPRRLWKRYVVYNSLFIFHLLKQMRQEEDVSSKP